MLSKANLKGCPRPYQGVKLKRFLRSELFIVIGCVFALLLMYSFAQSVFTKTADISEERPNTTMEGCPTPSNEYDSRCPNIVSPPETFAPPASVDEHREPEQLRSTNKPYIPPQCPNTEITVPPVKYDYDAPPSKDGNHTYPSLTVSEFCRSNN